MVGASQRINERAGAIAPALRNQLARRHYALDTPTEHNDNPGNEQHKQYYNDFLFAHRSLSPPKAIIHPDADMSKPSSAPSAAYLDCAPALQALIPVEIRRVEVYHSFHYLFNQKANSDYQSRIQDPRPIIKLSFTMPEAVYSGVTLGKRLLFPRLIIFWRPREDLNLWPFGPQPNALSAELRGQN